MRKAFAALAIIAGLIAGCAPPLPRPTEPAGQGPANFPAQHYQEAIARGEPQPSEADIAGTQRNMLTRVLEVERYPFALIAVSDVVPGDDDAVVTVATTLHGITRTTRVPVRIETANDEIAVNGRVVLEQSDFGITPLSILGGAVQVADEINLRLWIRARRCFTQACR